MLRLKKEKIVIDDKPVINNTISSGEIQFKKELVELPSFIIPQGKLHLNNKNIMEFKVVYTPEKDSYWYPGLYEFNFSVPTNYPFSPPKIHCLTKIFHPNIDLQGNVCLNILREDWKPTLNMATVIASVYFLFYDPNPKDPLNHEASEMMRNSRDEFIKNVKKTLKGGRHYGEEFKKF